MPEAPGPVVRCSGLVKIYPAATGEVHALRGVDADVHRGSVVAVTGPSGSGKSSLLQLLATRERQSGGDLVVLGRPVASLRRTALRRLRRRHVAWVAQRPSDGLVPHLTARENVLVVARQRGADVGEVDPLLEALGLPARAGSRAAVLSGGEQQRLAVAVAAVGAPDLLVADEPSAELDDASAALVAGVLAGAAAGGSAVVVATHDQRLVGSCDRVLHLRHGVLSTDRVGAGPAVAAIDSTGRLQLPPEALPLFPASRALVVVEGDQVRLLPPEAGP